MKLSRILSVIVLVEAVVNGASAQAPTISFIYNGATPDLNPLTQFSQNCWLTIKGSNLASSIRNWASQDFVNGQMPTQLDGVTVTVNGKPAALNYISPTQVNFLSPVDNSAGPVNIQITNNARGSTTKALNIVKFSPGLFIWQYTYVVATHADFSLVGPPGLFPNATTTPASPGETIILWATGLGATDPPLPAGVLPTHTSYVTDPVTVVFGGRSVSYVTPVSVAVAPGYAGLYQVAVKIPDSITSDVSVALQVGAYSSNSLKLTIAPEGGGGPKM